jgi:AcrR family transcriptional regulator
MSHRERLLEGAKRCLLEKGYARTTARDIVAASGTNLGSIGYHYGSTEALLNTAMIEAFEEWGEEMNRLLATAHGRPGSLERLESLWELLIETFETHRMLWIAGFEAFSRAQRSPGLREQIAVAYESARPGLTAMFNDVDENEVDEATARTIGSLLLAVQAGLATQWLLDPEHAPSANDMVEALRRISAPAEPDASSKSGKTRSDAT